MESPWDLNGLSVTLKSQSDFFITIVSLWIRAPIDTHGLVPKWHHGLHEQIL